ncbi:ras guanine nucleotide exchange factor domain-containing protein [Cokeromyces recurvatus]|uniref:ras guanine nucleotide exchange factor domain-containing protein n=1 Tax=Cokeromyces recurvatus TaxID=90255 RepID=UPI00221F8718|nr:ras guanine nucleotide exchange factor domain-containing protein [Cokeromyces recurvatus]KAI7905568.1 ras guanine nucleotide exchange factor domain-containing protein [Cokeromyces recurvatus]
MANNTNTNSISDFLFSDDTNRVNKRSQSLTGESNYNNHDNSYAIKNHQRPIGMKLIHRSSAPNTSSISSNSTLPTLSSEMMKQRSYTSGDTSAKLKQFFGDDLPQTSSVDLTENNMIGGGVGVGGGVGPNSEQIQRKASIAPSITVSTTATLLQEDEQRFLQYDYSPNEIVFTAEGSVKGGTLKALVERMTLHDYLDMNFNSTFLLTYRSFCTSMELLELLEARYNIQPPPDLLPDELEIWANKKQKLVRLRVFNVLKIWLEQYYYEEDSIILDRLLHFTNTSIKQSLSFSAYQLERLIQKRKEVSNDIPLKKLVSTQPQDLPEPILPRNLKKFRLLDVDPTEMARQLTLMDFKLYNAIKPVECLDKAWSRDHSAPNIQSSIDYCNQITTWVSDEILSQSEVKKRSTLIKYWVNVAERCRVYNNFNTCMAILSAFDNSAVGRLKRTWEMVGARTNHIVAHMRKLMGANRNFNRYRALIHSVNPPCIPFLGIYLQDLTFIEDGNPNTLKTSKDFINFAKRAKTAEVIREIQQYQTMGYHFKPVEEIQTFITENLHSSRDEDQLYKESLKLEPKERDDEKITRLLQESGFL